ncbi:AP-4 complex subunit beta-1 [Labeo rohita]|uniref:AP-4 complex subunit beta-1 n=1 Tax=Labeo rohita TaxID=84645 RepID=A0ABQ8LEZ0_LABRO|nr:AP-4 complex subunit beta-1 [Labeo rohita]
MQKGRGKAPFISGISSESFSFCFSCRCLQWQFCHSYPNTFSLPTRHILTLGQDPLASLFEAQGTPLASFFDL